MFSSVQASVSNNSKENTMGLAERRQKDSANAARMKRDGVTRKTMSCPICYAQVSIESFPGHVRQGCKGKKKGKE